MAWRWFTVTFSDWAARWPDAARELRAALTPQRPFPLAGASDAAVQQQVRYNHAVNTGGALWRNNVGVLIDARGVPVRYGLANDSKAVNEQLKSADLVGITPRLITPEMVGTTVGVFTSRECKASPWRWRGDAHEEAQLAWAALVWSLGGDACIVDG